MNIYRYYYLDFYKTPEIIKVTKVFYNQGKMFYELSGRDGYYQFKGINEYCVDIHLLYKLNKKQQKKLMKH